MNHILKAIAAGVVTGTIIFATVAMVDPSADESAYGATITTPDKVVGNTQSAAYVFEQTSGDCEEGAVDVVFGTVTGARMKEATVEKEAVKLGVLAKNYADGSNWDGKDGILKLLRHYDLTATQGSHSITTIETDLELGDHIIALVNSNTLWATLNEAQLVQALGAPPAGDIWETGPVAYPPSTVPNHVLVLDSIDETAHTATVSDTGMGLTYSVPLSTFLQAESGGGYQFAVVTK